MNFTTKGDKELKMVSVKHILFLFLLFILFLPLMQRTYPIINITPLTGAITPAENISFKIRKWFSGEYQTQKEKFLNETFGFRNILIRLSNQISFSLFNKSNNNKILVGKDHYLYGYSYIHSYFGTDFIGADSMNLQVSRLKLIQDTLVKLNKNLILVIAPGKGYYYPEYIPDKFKIKRGETNYDSFLRLAKTSNLNCIDFNQYFMDNKYKSKYVLYPKYGIHWSYYGACMAGDSIINYIETLRHIDMPNITWTQLDTGFIKPGDSDLGNGLNLLFALKSGHLAYPRLEFQSDSGKIKPSVLVVGDSFYNILFDYGIEKCFSQSSFWYYNKKNYPSFYPNATQTDIMNLKDEIGKYDVIVLMSTEAGLHNLGWGFIDEVYDMFYGMR